jgi:type II secretory pathway component PulC
MIQKGPGHLLRYIRVSPSHKARRFLGFRLDEVMTQDPRFQSPNVSAGDIILHINKVRIQTPGDFHKAFLTLKNSQKIVFDILRGERRFLVIYPVLNDVTLQPDGAQ